MCLKDAIRRAPELRFTTSYLCATGKPHVPRGTTLTSYFYHAHKFSCMGSSNVRPQGIRSSQRTVTGHAPKSSARAAVGMGRAGAQPSESHCCLRSWLALSLHIATAIHRSRDARQKVIGSSIIVRKAEHTTASSSIGIALAHASRRSCVLL